MDAFWAMSLPGLVVALVVIGACDIAVTRHRRHHGDPRARARAAEVGVDGLGLALAPGRRHTTEHDEFVRLDRDDEGDGAPPRSVVDLDAGTARLVITPRH